MPTRFQLFSRRSGETLTDYIRRADKLAKKCTLDFDHLLAQNFLNNLRDGENGKDIQAMTRRLSSGETRNWRAGFWRARLPTKT